MTERDKITIYLRNIAKRPTLEEAQRDARLALRLMGIDVEKEEGKWK